MNSSLVDGIVRAVLYEGYMLYPYRPSAIKNRQRFNFGVVYPKSFSEASGGGDAAWMQTECLVTGNAETECAVRVKFLRMVTRSIGRLSTPATSLEKVAPEAVESVDSLEIDGNIYQPWQEAVEEVIEVAEFKLGIPATQPMPWPFRLSARREQEAIRDDHGLIVGIIQREKRAMAGTIELRAQEVRPGLFQVRVRVANDSRIEGTGGISREKALASSLVSAHTILEVRNGEFISLLDPPEACREAASACQNIGTWPVLVGVEGQRDTMLSSPDHFLRLPSDRSGESG